MPDTQTYGLPDIELAGAQGHKVNPSHFAGHDMVVLFCPADEQTARPELTEYNALADQLAYNDAYMIAVRPPDVGAPGSRILIVTDTERSWEAFRGCASKRQHLDPDAGVVFLFGRGGCLRQVWQGTGHANEVMRALGERM